MGFQNASLSLLPNLPKKGLLSKHDLEKQGV
jgi:hypothetical protein